MPLKIMYYVRGRELKYSFGKKTGIVGPRKNLK